MPGRTPAEGRLRATWCFHREGDVWSLAYERRTVRLKDALGLRYLAHLLRHPGQSFHVSELVAAVGGQTVAAVPRPANAPARRSPTASGRVRPGSAPSTPRSGSTSASHPHRDA